ncbi:MAG TPA: hypothetical protein VGE69_12260 [Pseudomonadales bacterium]
MSVAAVCRARGATFSMKACALLLGGVLVSQASVAHPNGESVWFHAARVPPANGGAGDTPAQREVASFAAFIPLSGPFADQLADATRLRAQLADLEERGEQYSPQFAELSEQLGRALQAKGEHRAALAAFDRGFQVNRRQEGLHSPMQAALLRAQIDSQLALGDVEAVDLLQHALFSMQQELLTADPAAMAAAHRDAADWNILYYLQMQQVAIPGGITQAEQHARAERLGTALGQYHRALWLLTTAAPPGAYDARAAIERRIAAVMLLTDRQFQLNAPALLSKPGLANLHQDKRTHNPALFAHGSAALQRAAAYGADSAEPAQRATRQLELADWYLLMDQHDSARDAYNAALATLRAANVPEQQLQEVVESGMPVRDPERELRALAQPGAGDFDGYIDVAFDVDRYGKAHNARVLASADYDAAYDHALENELLREIHGTRFRPGFRGDVPVASKDVTLRYYYAR